MLSANSNVVTLELVLKRQQLLLARKWIDCVISNGMNHLLFCSKVHCPVAVLCSDTPILGIKLCNIMIHHLVSLTHCLNSLLFFKCLWGNWMEKWLLALVCSRCCAILSWEKKPAIDSNKKLWTLSHQKHGELQQSLWMPRNSFS